ncbi:hypothetical protein NMG60_11006564 [Bertholletia excelsa]
MATISGLSTLCSIYKSSSHLPHSSPSSSGFSSYSSLSIPFWGCRFQGRLKSVIVNSTVRLAVRNKKIQRRRTKIVRSVAEDTLAPEEAEQDDNGNTEQSVEQEASTPTDQPVSVPVLPSDVLTMFFQAEGTMNETAIPTVTSALEKLEGINNLKVQVAEGIASVELTKQTTVQATGVASNLVEIIQGSGFKLQTLNLSFEDEEDIM